MDGIRVKNLRLYKQDYFKTALEVKLDICRVSEWIWSHIEVSHRVSESSDRPCNPISDRVLFLWHFVYTVHSILSLNNEANVSF